MGKGGEFLRGFMLNLNNYLGTKKISVWSNNLLI